MPVETTRNRPPGSTKAELNVAQTYAQFDATLETMEEYLTTDTGSNATRLGVADSQVTALTTFQTDWTTKFNTYKNPATHTPAAVEAVRVAYKTGSEQVREIQQQVKNNNSVEKTADDYKSLSIHIDKETRTPVDRPAVAPLVLEIEIKPGSNKFRFSEPSGEGQAHKHLPYRTHLRYRIAHVAPGGETPPPDGDYTGIHESGRAEITVIAPPNLPKGTHGFIRGCFVNNKGEAGPECDPLEYVIN